jgi:hypothetical protein
MYFGMKNYLKSNHYHTDKDTLKDREEKNIDDALLSNPLNLNSMILSVQKVEKRRF